MYMGSLLDLCTACIRVCVSRLQEQLAAADEAPIKRSKSKRSRSSAAHIRHESPRSRAGVDAATTAAAAAAAAALPKMRKQHEAAAAKSYTGLDDHQQQHYTQQQLQQQQQPMQLLGGLTPQEIEAYLLQRRRTFQQGQLREAAHFHSGQLHQAAQYYEAELLFCSRLRAKQSAQQAPVLLAADIFDSSAGERSIPTPLHAVYTRQQ
jgi:hypothetical protein